VQARAIRWLSRRARVIARNVALAIEFGCWSSAAWPDSARGAKCRRFAWAGDDRDSFASRPLRPGRRHGCRTRPPPSARAVSSC
jgi:hypothetical protein